MAFFEKFKFLGKHYRMERFIVTFSILFFLLVIVTGAGLKVKIDEDRQLIGEDAIYTQNFSSSRTKINGSVVNVFSNKDKTKAFLLLKFSDLGAISTDAKNYQMFLTPADVSQNPKTKVYPAASVYIFGSTGYMGVYFVNKAGFDKQILTLTFRANSELIEIGEVESATYDVSFEKYDQFVVNFNPGGSKATLMECLEQEDAPTYTDLYNQAIIVNEEQVIRDNLDVTLLRMQLALKRIEEYRTRLVAQWGVVIPKSAETFDGDEVIGTKEEGNLVLVTDYVYPGGFNFDWRSGTVREGYLDQLMDKKKYLSYEDFFLAKNKEVAPSGSYSKLLWQLNDGTYVDDLNVGGANGRDRYTKINTDIQRLVGAWQDYQREKEGYQKGLLRNLLTLELDLKVIDRITTVNTSEEVLICY